MECEDKKKGSSRYERIPETITNEIRVDHSSDYLRLIPDNLPVHFTTKDMKKASGLSLRNTQAALNVLNYVGAIVQTGKEGNAFVYEKA